MLGGVIEWWDEYRSFAFLDFVGHLWGMESVK